jgi:hypothetical protein
MHLIKKKSLLFALCFALFSCLSAQEKTDSVKTPQHEFGLNVTGLITNLIGSNNQTDLGAYLISYKHLKGNKAFRLGATANIAYRRDNTLSFETKLNSQNLQLRMGQETRHPLSKRSQYYFGFDGVIGYRLEESTGITNFSTIIQKDEVFSIGLGPVVGFQFAIYDHLLIGTEGSLYAVFNKSSITFTDSKNSNNNTIPKRESNLTSLQTTLPKFIFVILKF